MLWLVTAPAAGNTQLRTYQQIVRSELQKRQIPHRQITAADQSEKSYRHISDVPAQASDAWFLTDAANPLLQAVGTQPGRTYAHVHGPRHLCDHLRQRQSGRSDPCDLLGMCDGVFVSSAWSKKIISEHCGSDHKDKIVVSGFPFDPAPLVKHRSGCTDSNLIVFAQRFCPDNLHILETWLAESLLRQNYRVQHICEMDFLDDVWRDREARILLREARLRGLQLVVCKDRSDYWTQLSRGSVLISTCISGRLPTETLEAAALRTPPLAPQWGSIAEYMPQQNLYPPFNLESLLDMIASSPAVFGQPEMSNPTTVVDIYCQTMEVS